MRTPIIVQLRSGPINLLPIISVLLVLVLLLCGVVWIARNEFSSTIDLPQSTFAVKAPRSPTLPRIVVNVESDGQMVVAGREVDRGELEALLRVEQSKDPTS